MARAARRVSRLVVSALLLIAGAAMLVLPGPGLLTIAVALGIAGRELDSEQIARWERRVRRAFQRASGGAGRLVASR